MSRDICSYFLTNVSRQNSQDNIEEDTRLRRFFGITNALDTRAENETIIECSIHSEEDNKLPFGIYLGGKSNATCRRYACPFTHNRVYAGNSWSLCTGC